MLPKNMDQGKGGRRYPGDDDKRTREESLGQDRD